jgi:hypothetical protein
LCLRARHAYVCVSCRQTYADGVRSRCVQGCMARCILGLSHTIGASYRCESRCARVIIAHENGDIRTSGCPYVRTSGQIDCTTWKAKAPMRCVAVGLLFLAGMVFAMPPVNHHSAHLAAPPSKHWTTASGNDTLVLLSGKQGTVTSQALTSSTSEHSAPNAPGSPA